MTNRDQHDAILVEIYEFLVWPRSLLSVIEKNIIAQFSFSLYGRRPSFVLSAKIVLVSTGVVISWKSVDWNKILTKHIYNHSVIRCEALIKRPDLKFDTGSFCLS